MRVRIYPNLHVKLTDNLVVVSLTKNEHGSAFVHMVNEAGTKFFGWEYLAEINSYSVYNFEHKMPAHSFKEIESDCRELDKRFGRNE